MAIAYQCNATDDPTTSGYYVSENEDGGFLPSNATYDAPPSKPWLKKWPQYTAGIGWKMVEDHRERKPPYFEEEFTQEATSFWIEGEDDWQSQPRVIKTPGPLPEGHTLTQPEKPLTVAQDEKRREIDAGYEAALIAALTMPSASPTPMAVAVETSALLAVDPDGVDSIRAVLEARRAELHTQVDGITVSENMDNAAAVLAVKAIAVSYPV